MSSKSKDFNLITIILSSLIFVAVIFSVLEGFSFLVLSNETLLDRTLGILQQDQKLLWKQRANLNVEFEGEKVQTNNFGMRFKEPKVLKKKDVFRIICLGGSPTFGWGVREENTYAVKLKELLSNKYPDKKIEVLNAGMIGYSSFQGVKLLENEILKLSPDLITVAYVINDVDKYRFFQSNGRADKDLKKRNQALIVLENLLYQSRFVRVYQKMVYKFQNWVSKKTQKGAQLAYRSIRRVDLDDYEKNLRKMINIAHNNRVKVVLIKMPVNLPPSDTVLKDVKLKMNEHINNGIASNGLGNYEGAIIEFNFALELNPFSTESYFYLSRSYAQLGKEDIAQDYLQKLKEKELNECGRLAKAYNKRMEDVSKHQGVALVDIVSVFEKKKKKLQTSFFQDDRGDLIHPNELGHAIIGKAIYDVLINNSLIN